MAVSKAGTAKEIADALQEMDEKVFTTSKARIWKRVFYDKDGAFRYTDDPKVKVYLKVSLSILFLDETPGRRSSDL